MEYLCSSKTIQELEQDSVNQTFADSISSMTDCSFNFLQIVVNCFFIYSILIILVYRVYCVKSCGASSESRFRKFHKGRTKHGLNGLQQRQQGRRPVALYRRRNSKSMCSDNVFIENNKFPNNDGTFSGTPTSTTAPSHFNTYETVEDDVDGNNYEIEYNFEGDEDVEEDENLRRLILQNTQKKSLDKSRQLFTHHISIWIFSFTFILVVAIQCAESIIVFIYTTVKPSPNSTSSAITSDSIVSSTNSSSIRNSDNEPQTIYYLRVFSSFTSILTLLLTLCIFHHSETTRRLKYLWMNIVYFLTCIGFGFIYLYFYFYKTQLSWAYVKIVVNCCSVLNAGGLVGLLIHTFLSERKIVKALAQKSLHNVKYLHYHTSLLSRLVFFWFTAILRIGYRRPLESDDLGALPPEEKTQFQYERFNEKYQEEKKKYEDNCPEYEFSLWKCLFKTLGPSLGISGFFRLIADLTGFVAPLGIRTIVRYVGQNTTALSDSEGMPMEHMSVFDVFSNGYVMAIIILLSAVLQSTFSQCSTFLVNSEGIHIKVALQALIYKKSLTLSPTKSSQYESHSSSNSSKNGDIDDEDGIDRNSVNSNNNNHSSGFDSGSILNILSEDTNNIMMFFWMVNYIWAIPLKLSILMGLLYLQLGFSALIGAGICILVMIPLQFYLGKKMSNNSKELMERCDERLRSISEILQGMKLLKLQGWELIFGKQVIDIREQELKNLDRDLLYRSIMTFLTHISSVLVTLVTFGLYSYIETEKLEPSKVFAGLALFNQLTVPLFIFPITVPVVIDALVSAKRVREFLLMPEAVSYTKNDDETNESDENGIVKGQLIRLPIKFGDIKTDAGTESLPKTPTTGCHPLIKSLKLPKASDVDASTDSVFAPIAEEHEDEDEDDDDDDDEYDDLGEESADDMLDNSEDEVDNVQEKKPVSLLKAVIALGNSNKTPASLLPPIPSVKEARPKRVILKNLQFEPPTKLPTPLASPKSPTIPDIDLNVDPTIIVTNGEFSWETDRSDQTLADINLRIPSHNLTIIVGPIGSGKSSLISAILGEMRKVSGEVHWKRDVKIAYAAQKPWILNATVKENILFGKNYKSRRFKKVIDACSLQPDIDILPARENTEIGEKGINLSGGQRQRIAIARALYSNADVIILDDPLSALDSEVAQHIFNSGIRKFLLKAQKTVILVTHHLPVLRHAYKIIAMEKGRIRIEGTYKGIESSDPKLFEEWKRIIRKRKDDLENKKGAKTAKERWSLLKIVSTVGITKPKAVPKTTEEDKKWEGYRKRKETFSHHKTLSHEYRAGDECYYEDIMAPLLCHRQISRLSKESRTSTSSVSMKPMPSHPPLSRMTSLQVEKRKSPIPLQKVQRLQSLPVDEESGPRARSGTNDSSTMSLLKVKRKFYAKKQISSSGSASVTDLDKLAVSQRLVSTVSGDTDEIPEDEPDEDSLLMSRESSQDEREYGLIPIRVYLTYIASCGHILSSFYLLVAIGYEVVHVYTNFWLKEWSDEVSRSPDYQYDDVMSHYFTVYVLLSIITVIVSLTSNIIGKQAGANSRRKLHSQMFNCIIRCPVRFFDTTPIGRIINRFASDVAVVDRKLCVSMQRFLQFVFLCISAIVVNAIVNPWFLIVAIPIVVIYYGLQRFYRFSSRELHRIEAISRGPIFSHFHETLEGLSTIRAFGVQRRFTNQMLATIDVNNTAAIFINSGNRWLSISLDYLGSVIVFLATFVSMISSQLHPDVVTPSMVGLAINYTLLVPVYLNHVVKFLAEVEMFMNSVDRINRFSKQEIEDYGDENATNIPDNWPTQGSVTFDNVSVRYSSTGPSIITDLKCTIPPEQKVGVCGRSGSGKSSLLMSLFRISEISNGKIEIDGCDVNKVPLLKLRSGIAIIPQENILFSGTIRFNLDPESKCGDAEIWRALELGQMKRTIQDMPGQLDAEVKDGGAGFSAGQRQLLGLARAILHKTKVVIMDEATSSVDLATETTLLQVVNEVFKDSTVLTIAHRLGTITNGDRVLVLDAGRLVEDGSPKELMSGPTSIFATMLKNSDD